MVLLLYSITFSTLSNYLDHVPACWPSNVVPIGFTLQHITSTALRHHHVTARSLIYLQFSVFPNTLKILIYNCCINSLFATTRKLKVVVLIYGWHEKATFAGEKVSYWDAVTSWQSFLISGEMDLARSQWLLRVSLNFMRTHPPTRFRYEIACYMRCYVINFYRNSAIFFL